MRRSTQIGTWLACVVLVALALLWWSRAATPVEPDRAVGRQTPSAAQPATAGARAADEGAVQRELVAPPEAPEAGPTATVRGRCIAAEDGRPLAGVQVEVRTQGPQPVGTAVSGEDGTFTVGVPTVSFDLLLHQTGRLQLLGTWQEDLTTGATEDLGDLRMVTAFPVRGQVVDERGAPVEGATVHVFLPMQRVAGPLMTLGFGTASSAADGAFEFRSETPVGKHNASASGKDCEGSVDFTVSEARGTEPLHIVVRPVHMRSLGGRVVDDLGAPVADVFLMHLQGDGAGSTDAQGRFRIEEKDAGDGQDVDIEVAQPGRCERPPTQRLRWGDQDCRIVLRRAQRLVVEAVDEAGAPVEHFSVWLGPSNNNPDGRFRAGGNHPDGRAVVEPARRGKSLLRVLPENPDLALSAPQELDIGDAEPASVRVVLARLHQCTVEVVDGKGAPVARAELALVQRKEGPSSFLKAFDPRASTQWDPGTLNPDLVAAATTGPDGRAELRCPAATAALVLRVEGDGFARAALSSPALAPGTPLRVVLTASGSIRGHVDRRAEPDARFSATVRSSDGREETVQVGRDGSFGFDALSPGIATVLLTRQVECSGNGYVGWHSIKVAEQSAVVRPAAATVVTFEAPPRATGRVRGRLRCVGIELKDERVTARTVDAEMTRGEFSIDANGAFAADNLLPGRWRIAVQGRSWPWYHEFADELEVTSDSDLDREFVLTRRRLVLQLQNVDGTLLQGPCTLRIGGQTREVRGPEVVLDPAPALPLQVRAAGGDNEWSPAYTLPAGGDEVTATLTVPAPK
jgi:hypothetical protein